MGKRAVRPLGHVRRRVEWIFWQIVQEGHTERRSFSPFVTQDNLTLVKNSAPAGRQLSGAIKLISVWRFGMIAPMLQTCNAHRMHYHHRPPAAVRSRRHTSPGLHGVIEVPLAHSNDVPHAFVRVRYV